jgi:hypothetical protein
VSAPVVGVVTVAADTPLVTVLELLGSVLVLIAEVPPVMVLLLELEAAVLDEALLLLEELLEELLDDVIETVLVVVLDTVLVVVVVVAPQMMVESTKKWWLKSPSSVSLMLATADRSVSFDGVVNPVPSSGVCVPPCVNGPV